MKIHKYITHSTVIPLCAAYDITPPDPFTQDWHIESADPDKVHEWLTIYETDPLDDDEKFALLGLILCSLDDSTYNNDMDEQGWTRLSSILKNERQIHQHWIHYWCVWDHSEENIADAFALTPYMRGLGMSNPKEASEWLDK